MFYYLVIETAAGNRLAVNAEGEALCADTDDDAEELLDSALAQEIEGATIQELVDAQAESLETIQIDL